MHATTMVAFIILFFRQVSYVSRYRLASMVPRWHFSCDRIGDLHLFNNPRIARLSGEYMNWSLSWVLIGAGVVSSRGLFDLE